jgi:hypothetical protein
MNCVYQGPARWTYTFGLATPLLSQFANRSNAWRTSVRASGNFVTLRAASQSTNPIKGGDMSFVYDPWDPFNWGELVQAILIFACAVVSAGWALAAAYMYTTEAGRSSAGVALWVSGAFALWVGLWSVVAAFRIRRRPRAQ